MGPDEVLACWDSDDSDDWSLLDKSQIFQALRIAIQQRDEARDGMSKWAAEYERWGVDNFKLAPEADILRKERDEARAALNSLLNKVNAVTAPWRHHAKVPFEKMDDLCNRQIEVEKVLEKSGG